VKEESKLRNSIIVNADIKTLYIILIANPIRPLVGCENVIAGSELSVGLRQSGVTLFSAVENLQTGRYYNG